jgi:phenol hydroxylase P0 protein
VPFHQLPQAKPAFDLSRHYVRFRELRDDGYVLFDFAIGDPELAVELTLPLAAYQTFCRERGVIYLTREQAETIDFERTKWRYGSPGIQE